MMLEIKVLDSVRHKCVAGLNRLIGKTFVVISVLRNLQFDREVVIAAEYSPIYIDIFM